MKPILNFLESLVDKYIVHIPEDKKKQYREDAIEAAKALVEAGAKGAAAGVVEGAKNG